MASDELDLNNVWYHDLLGQVTVYIRNPQTKDDSGASFYFILFIYLVVLFNLFGQYKNKKQTSRGRPGKGKYQKQKLSS